MKDTFNDTGATVTSVKLATGMKIGSLIYSPTNNSGSTSIMLKNLLTDNQTLKYDTSDELIDIYKKSTANIYIRNPITVVEHTNADHKYSSDTGKCDCGYTCEHNDIDIETGICSVCKYQFTASVSGVSGKATEYFDDIDKAFNAAVSEENNGCTLTIYKDCEITDDPIIEKTLSLNVNGKTITTSDKEIIVKLGTLTLTGGGKIDGNVTVAGSTLINGVNDTNDSKAVSITNLYANYIGEAPHIELYGGAYDSFIISDYVPDVAIYGGSFGKIKSQIETSITVGTLLAENRAFMTVNSVTLIAETLVDGSAVTLYEGLTNVVVEEHTHVYNEETGKCPCGVCALAVFTETTQSEVTYTFIESAIQFKNIAENEADGVLKLTGDVDCGVAILTINGNKTIDMNGHTLNVSDGTETNAFLSVYGNVTFENSGSDRAVINAEGVYNCEMTTVNGDIKYRLRIKSCKSGRYSVYTYINVTTKPYTTTGMKAKTVTKSSITLQWNKNTSADGYCIEKYDGKKWVQIKRYSSNASTTFTIKSLKSKTTYKFRMRAFKTTGNVTEYSAYTYCTVKTK